MEKIRVNSPISLTSLRTLAFFFLVCVSCAIPQESCADDKDVLLLMINQLRASQSPPAPPLQIHPQLVQSAQSHTDDMLAQSFFSHYSLDGSTPTNRMMAAGFIGERYGECIAAREGPPDPAYTFSQWTGSSTHLALLIKPDYNYAGIGLTYGYWGYFGSFSSIWTLDLGQMNATFTPTATPTMTRTPTRTPTATPTPIQGWSEAQGNKDMTGLVLYGDRIAQEMAGLSAQTQASSSHVLCHFRTSTRWYTGLVIANPDPLSSAHLTIQAYDDLGGLLGTVNRTVPPKGKISGIMSSLFGLSSATGWVKVDSDLPVHVFDLYGDMVSGGIAALPRSVPASVLVLPHFRCSSRWWTGIAIANPNSVSVDVTVTAYTDLGVNLGQTTQTVPAMGKVSHMVSALYTLTGDQSGWLGVETSGNPVAACVIYGDSKAVPNQIAALPAVSTSTSFTLSDFRSNTEWWTGVVLVNPDGVSKADVTLTARAKTGALIDTESREVLAHQKVSGLVSGLFTLGSESEGWIEATSTLPVVGLEILQANDPVQQMWGLAGVESQPKGTLVAFAHHVVSTRWWTLLSLANTDGAATVQPTWTAYKDSGAFHSVTSPVIPQSGLISDDLQDIFSF